MTVTEVALLRLQPNITIHNTNIRSKLAHAKKVMQDYTGHTFYYFQQVQDSACIYVLGEWESLDQHWNEFIPSAENQEVLESLKGLMTVERLLHIDTTHADLPLPKTDPMRDRALQDDPVMAIVRYFVKDEKKADFEENYTAKKQHLQDFVAKGTIGGGWRVDTENNKDEWVLLCSFKSVQEDEDSMRTGGFEKYGQIEEHIDGADIKYAKLLDI
jgi:quinol monooxygenase YgiN